MQKLLSALYALPEFQQLAAALDSGASPAAVSGLSLVHRAWFAAAIQAQSGRPVVVLCADDADCQRLSADLRALSGEEAITLPSREFTFHNAAVVSRTWEHQRLETLWRVSQGQFSFLVAPAEAFLQRTVPPALLTRASRVLKMGDRKSVV